MVDLRGKINGAGVTPREIFYERAAVACRPVIAIKAD